VDRRASGCHHCGCTFGRRRPVHVKGSGHGLSTLLRPLPVWLLSTAALAAFAVLARGDPAMGRAYVWTFIGALAVGLLLVTLMKAWEGPGELFDFLWHASWLSQDDPLDGWMLVIVLTGVEGLLFMWLIVHPTMPRAWWP
jgi:hypothetical protein